MNERIKELADNIWSEEYWTKPNTDKLLPAQLNRFAELIIRECASIVDNVEPGYTDYRSQIEVMMRNDCVKVLLHKFDMEDDRSETRQITGDD